MALHENKNSFDYKVDAWDVVLEPEEMYILYSGWTVIRVVDSSR